MPNTLPTVLPSPPRRPFAGRGRRFVFPGLLAAAGLAAALFVAGCGETSGDHSVVPRKIEYRGPNAPFAEGVPLGGPLKTPLLFMLTGAPADNPGAPAKWPAAGAVVTFEVDFEDADGRVERLPAPEPAVADAGGAARLPLAVGDKPGVYRVRAQYEGGRAVEAVLLAGFVVENARQDGWSGHDLAEPLVVRYETAPGRFADAGRVEAYIEEGSPEGSRLGAKALPIDPESRAAEFVVFDGTGQGPGAVALRALDSPMGPAAARYQVRATFFTINWFMMLSSVVGGLALFIYGMDRMSEGLKFVAGDKLRQVLHWLTSNRFVAVGVGVFITAAIQSSSATSVMVVGFVNAGLMSLQQAIGVLMGANIGTTVTAQIIAFKLDDIALPAVAIGVAIHALAKSSKVKNAAMILTGFGMLFLGLTIMGDSLTTLKDSQSAKDLFSALKSGPDENGLLHVWPVLKGVFAGIVVTMIVQSSSVTTGLLIMLAAAGLMDAYTAYAVLLGENIGTTVTAIIASFGSTRAARRAALFHVLFNTFGVIAMVFLHFVPWPGTGHPVFMQLVAAVTDGDPFAGENLPRYLANAHTMFNLVVAAVFLFLIRPMAALCTWLVPETEEERNGKRRRLEPKFLATPAIAIQQVWTQLEVALAQGHAAVDEAYRALGDPSDPDWDKLSESVKERERETDQFQIEVTEFLGQLSLARLNESQAEAIPHLLHGVNDVERIGDFGRHLLKLANRTRKRSLPFTSDARAELMQLITALEDMFSGTGDALQARASDRPPHEKRDAMRQAAAQVKVAHRFIKKNASEFRKNHEVRHENGQCDIRSGVVFLDVVATLSRVGGHLANIVEAAEAAGE